MKLDLIWLCAATALAKNQLLCSNVTAPTSFSKWVAPFGDLISAFIHDTSADKCDRIFSKHSSDGIECRQQHCPAKFNPSQFKTIEIASWTQYANISDDGKFITTLVQGYAFASPECGSQPIKRRLALGRILRMTGYNVSWEPSDILIPREYISWAVNGAQPILTINENTTIPLPISTGTYGHFETFITVPLPWTYQHFMNITTIPLTLSLAGCSESHISLPTRVDTLIVPPKGVTIISDIDDILRVSEIWDPKQAFLDLFVRPFQPCLDLPDLFALLKNAVPDAHFHYTSDVPELSSDFYTSGTDELYVPLLALLLCPTLLTRLSNSYPRGSFDFRPTAFTSWSQTSTPRYHNIRRQLLTFPSRSFVLLGDTSTASTLSAYVRLAKEFPEQVQCIIIRDVAATEPADWIVATLKPLRKLQGRFLIFANPGELTNMTDVLTRLSSGEGNVGCGGLKTDTGVTGHGMMGAWAATGWNLWSFYSRCWLLGSVRPHRGCRFDRRAVEGYGDVQGRVLVGDGLEVGG
jgi:hypothetical protein